MFLNLQTHDYDKDIVPFIRNGIIIDSSVFITIVDGIVSTRFSKKESQDFKDILSFLDYIKMTNKWSKFFITPQILTEICTHTRNVYSKWENYSEIIKEIVPMLADMIDKPVKKADILPLVDFKNPILEIGDISIYVVADDFANKREKIAILASDRELNGRYQDNEHIMVLDYKSNILNLL